jgi:hypothetical protein
MFVQVQEVKCDIRKLSFVTVLSPVRAVKVKGRGYGTSLTYYCSREHDNCGKKQEPRVHVSGQHPTELTWLQELLKRHQVSSWFSGIIKIFHHFSPNLSNSDQDSPDQGDDRIRQMSTCTEEVLYWRQFKTVHWYLKAGFTWNSSLRSHPDLFVVSTWFVYYELRKREVKIRLMNAGRCDERLNECGSVWWETKN